MITLLYLIMLISLPMTFALAVVYFVYLYRLKVAIANDHAEAWNRERRNSRPLDSWAQSVYRILKRVRFGSLDGEVLSPQSASCARRASQMLLFGVVALMFFVSTSLALTFVDPMK